MKKYRKNRKYRIMLLEQGFFSEKPLWNVYLETDYPRKARRVYLRLLRIYGEKRVALLQHHKLGVYLFFRNFGAFLMEVA